MFKLHWTFGTTLLQFLILMKLNKAYSYGTLHGVQCTSTASCDYGMDCTLDIQGTYRCLCAEGFYKNDSGNCNPISRLMLYNSFQVTATTIIYKLYVTDKIDVEFSTNCTKEKTNVMVATQDSDNYQKVYITGLQSNTEYRQDHNVYIRNNIYYKNRLLKNFYTVVQTALAHTEICTLVSNYSNCESGTECTQDKNNYSRCLCKESQFRTDGDKCESLANLQVSNVSSNSDTNSITIHWTNSVRTETTSKYLVTYNNDEELIIADVTDVTISSLQSGREYEFHISVFIPPDNYYDNKTGVRYTHKASTVADYGDTCSSYIKCVQGFLCRASMNRSRCLCSDDNYKTDRNQCQHKDNLQVTNVTVRRTASAITFSWLSSTVGTKNAQFTIYGGLYGPLTASETGGLVNNLPHGTQFTFSIAVTLKDNYVNQTGPIYFLGVSTMSVYGEECDTNEDCDQGSHCLTAVNDTSRCLCNENEHRSATDQCVPNLSVIDAVDNTYKVIVIDVSCVLAAVLVGVGVACFCCFMKRKTDNQRSSINQDRKKKELEEKEDYDVLKIDFHSRNISSLSQGSENVYSACENENIGQEINHYIQPISGDMDIVGGHYNYAIEPDMQDTNKPPIKCKGQRNLKFPASVLHEYQTETDIYANKIV